VLSSQAELHLGRFPRLCCVSDFGDNSSSKSSSGQSDRATPKRNHSEEDLSMPIY